MLRCSTLVAVVAIALLPSTSLAIVDLAQLSCCQSLDASASCTIEPLDACQAAGALPIPAEHCCSVSVIEGACLGATCSTGRKGVCAMGTYQCGGDSISCVPDAEPSREICNGLDDNCNGKVDEGCQAPRFEGVLRDVPLGDLVGWEICHTDAYGARGTFVGDVLEACSKGQLMLACRDAGADVLTLAAHAARADVTFPTGGADAPDPNVPHEANGVAWYFDPSWSWGFAPVGATIDRDSCDAASADGDARLCWHTRNGEILPGYRCGETTHRAGDTAQERLILQAD